MSRNILVVTPLPEEYDDLYQSLVSYKLKSEQGKIGKLDVHRFSELNLTSPAVDMVRPSLGFKLNTSWITSSSIW